MPDGPSSSCVRPAFRNRRPRPSGSLFRRPPPAPGRLFPEPFADRSGHPLSGSPSARACRRLPRNSHWSGTSMNAPFRKEGRRILSLWLPCLGTDRILRQRLGRDWRSGTGQSQPLVLSRQENNSRRIAALDEKAERLGLRRGTCIADARAMYPSIEVVEADPEADRRLIEALADWCDRYTPLVTLDGVDGLFLDISGCAHLFGGERCLLDDIAARFFHQGFAVRAGLASTP